MVSASRSAARDQFQLDDDALASGRAVIEQEATALFKLAAGLDDRFGHAVDAILATSGRVIVAGLGKSGHVGRKIAATLASTGTSGFFLHAAEASHGDLGMVGAGDTLIILSNSGFTRELRPLLAHAKRLHVPVIGIGSVRNSPLALQSDILLPLPKEDEACPVRIAPTTSTTMMLALGDALALTVMRKRGLTRKDLAQWHPGGDIGHRLAPIDDVMDSNLLLPLVRCTAPLRDVVLEMTSVGKGVAGVVDQDGLLVGVITDGDLRRSIDQVLIARASDVMTHEPITVPSGTLVEDVLSLLNNAKITVVFVTDAKNRRRPIGVVHIHDLAGAA